MFKSFKTITGLIMCLHIYKTESHQVITSNKCITSKDSFVKLVGLSLGECVNACVRRHACQSVGFRRRMNFCELHKESNVATSANEDDSCIFIERKDMDTTEAQKCECKHVGHVCDPNSGQCTIAECGNLGLPNGKVYGNVNFIGAKLQIACNKGYVEHRGIKQVICKGNGEWEPTPTCEAEDLATTPAAAPTNTAESFATTVLTTSAAPVDTSVAQTNTRESLATPLPTTAAVPVDTAFLPSINYLGCFVDNDSRVLGMNMIDNDTMTTKMCFENCYRHGMRFFLTEFGKQCWCGNVLKNFDIRPDIECNMTCAGNNSEMCGGWWRGSVYDTMPLGAGLPSVSYLGCYVDNETRLIDLNSTKNDVMSTMMCYEYCYNTGTRFFLTEYSSHCFCGNVLRNYEIRPDTECNMPCAGNSSEKCGGVWRGSVYIRTNLDLCPVGWLRYGQSCYYFSSEKMTWQNALLTCQNHGSTLVEIDDSSENNFIVENVKQYTDVSYWIGLSDQTTEGTFVWYRSQRLLQKVDFSDWLFANPDDFLYNEDCTCISGPNSFHWNDATCTASNKFICKK